MIDTLLRLAWQFRARWRIGVSPPVVIMYHGTPRKSLEDCIKADVLDAHIALLKENFRIISLDEYLASGKPCRRLRVLITFDDGYQNNYTRAAPILKKHSVPAVFFVCQRSSKAGSYLWCTWLAMLRNRFAGDGFVFRGRYRSMKPQDREATLIDLTGELHSLRPYPAAMHEAMIRELPPLESFVPADEIDELCRGMTEEQIAAMFQDELFQVGVHTLDHVLLPRCDHAEALRQLEGCRAWLERLTGKPCDRVAYPCGEYDSRTLSLTSAAGLRHGFAVVPSLDESERLEHPRIGLYNPSPNVLGFKVAFGAALRRLGSLRRSCSAPRAECSGSGWASAPPSPCTSSRRGIRRSHRDRPWWHSCSPPSSGCSSGSGPPGAPRSSTRSSRSGTSSRQGVPPGGKWPRSHLRGHPSTPRRRRGAPPLSYCCAISPGAIHSLANMPA